MKKKYTIEIELKNVDVGEQYYSYDYTYSINGGKKKKGSYDSDYENGMSPERWKKELVNKVAIGDILINIGESIGE